MGEIILLAREAGRARKRREDDPTSARILFFTGVRYERAEVAILDAGDSGAPPAGGIGGGRRKRRG